MNNRSVAYRSDRARQVARVLWITLVLNWLVALLKVAFGLATHCMVILADGIHSFSDGTSNIVGLIAIYVSGHPADKGHPYGHQKYETLASALIAFVLFIVSFSIFKNAVQGFWHPVIPVVNAISFYLMGFTLVVNVFVVWFERREARRLKSDLLLSDSWHTLTDIFVTLTVFVALIGIQLKMTRMDSLFSIFIALVIFITAIMILKRSSDVLCDKAVLDTAQVERIVRAIPEVRDCHAIRTRGGIDDIYVDLHVRVDNEMTVLASHYLADRLEQQIKKEITGVRDVVVHIEPISQVCVAC